MSKPQPRDVKRVVFNSNDSRPGGQIDTFAIIPDQPPEKQLKPS